MRDILISVVLGLIIVAALRKPHIGAYGWLWYSVFNPHQLGYSFSRTLPWGEWLAITTLTGILFTREPKTFPWTAITVIYLALMLWMTFTSFFALASSILVWEQWLFVFKVHLMIFASMLVISGRKRIDGLIWVIVISLGLYGIKAGLWTLLTGGGHRVYGPQGGRLGNNNEFGLALVMTIPLIYYLYATASRKIIKLGLMASFFLCMVAALGSHSRGVFLALAAMTVFIGIRSKKLLQAILFPAFVAVIGYFVMPDSWMERMSTISTYQADGSATNRLMIWGMIWDLFKDSPIVGGGFRLDNQVFYARYAPSDFDGLILGPHSIYFQALGEHGLVGFLLYFGMLFLTWKKANQIRTTCEGNPQLVWASTLASMIQVGLVAYLVGAAFTHLMHLDLPYYWVATIVLLDVSVKHHIANEEPIKSTA